jgi:multiple sugar transport system substrate-binding protein
MSENDRDVQSLFMHGRVSMIITTYDSLNAFREAPFEYDIAPVPYSRQAKTLLNCTALGVPRTSRQQAAARLFVEFLASYEAQLALRQQTLSIPALKEAAEWKGDAPDEAAALNRPSRFALFREIIPTFHTYRALGLSYGQLMMMRDELKMYWSGFDPLDVVLGRIEQKLL